MFLPRIAKALPCGHTRSGDGKMASEGGGDGEAVWAKALRLPESRTGLGVEWAKTQLTQQAWSHWSQTLPSVPSHTTENPVHILRRLTLHLCNHHYHLPPEHFHLPKLKLCSVSPLHKNKFCSKSVFISPSGS